MIENVLRVDGGRLTAAGRACVGYEGTARALVRDVGDRAAEAVDALTGLAAGPALAAAVAAWDRAMGRGCDALAGFGAGLDAAARTFADVDARLAGDR